MAESAENEVRGLHALGNPDVEYRSADGGQTGEGPIGNRLPSGILARGLPAPGIRRGLGGVFAADSQLRKGRGR